VEADEILPTKAHRRDSCSCHHPPDPSVDGGGGGAEEPDMGAGQGGRGGEGTKDLRRHCHRHRARPEVMRAPGECLLLRKVGIRGTCPPAGAGMRAAEAVAAGPPNPVHREAPKMLLVYIRPRDPPQSLECHLKVPDGHSEGRLRLPSLPPLPPLPLLA
jgi:hypothetical protein